MNNSGPENMKNGSCLNREEMLRYLGGELGHRDQHRIENHLLECELCSDAMMGLEEMKDRSFFPGLDEQIKSGIEMMTAQEDTKVRVLFPWRMAAAFALILVSSLVLFLIIPKKTEQELFTQEYKPYPAPTDTLIKISKESEISSSANSGSQNQIIVLSEPKKSQEKSETIQSESDYPSATADEVSISQKDNTQSAAEPLIQENVKSTRENIADRVKETGPSIPAAKNAKTDNFSSVGTEESVQSRSFENENTGTLAASKLKKTADAVSAGSMRIYDSSSYQTGMTAYEQKNFREAIVHLEKSNVPEAIFYLALSYLSLDNPHSAIVQFEKYLKTGDKKYAEAAWWYSGLSYLKSKDKKLARKALKRVIDFHGEFEQQATELLRKI